MNSRHDLKEKLLGASMRLFLRKGYAGTTVNEIATLAGVSKGGLYWHFKSKEEIIDAILDRYHDQFVEEVTKKVKDCDGDFVTKFRAFYRFSTEFARDNRELLLVFTTLLVEFAGTETELERRMKRIHDAYTLTIQSLLEEGIRDGAVAKEIDPIIYARIFSSTLVGSQLQWYLGDWEDDSDPAYSRRHAITQRDALLKLVLSPDSSTTSGAAKTSIRAGKRRKR
jgi:AcrR family transcriptional regulator